MPREAFDRQLLSGVWDVRLDEEASWRPIRVPGCWEQASVRKDHSGPAWYRTRFDVPPEWSGRRRWLRFDAVSYHCEIFVNGRALGSHTGLWDAFAVEITGAATAGETCELLLRVEKPAGLTAGPDSASLPGRFPLRETLAGFLPYVWGHVFGGVWQDVALVATGQVVFEDVLVRGDADGNVRVEATLSAPAEVAIELRDPDGQPICMTVVRTNEDDGRWTIDDKLSHRLSSIVYRQGSLAGECVQIALETAVIEPRPWSPASPALYEARLAVADGDERVVRFGLRTLRADGATILLNERPIYPRMALSWGWYPDALNSNPGPDRVRADFERLRALGYNGVKLCLWFPPQYYFDLGDELGMLLWVELPMWIPRPSAFFRQQTPIEYERLMQLARQHPAVMLYTLGCELGGAVDAELLTPLYALVKSHAGDALVRDNSGSGEVYGGLLNELAEFYDNHFYSELQHFRGLLDSFAPRWRPAQPWLFGEFCDYDTFRDPRRLQIADCRLQIEDVNLQSTIYNLQYPWWMIEDEAVNPKGARWIYEVAAHERRLRASGLWERAAELERISERQGLWHRKYTIELARLYREVSGYVVSGEADTPISTAGMWDGGGRLKFDPGEFRAFNDDLVALTGWDRRRAWVAGGDRAAPWDTWSYPSGATVRPHLVASHYGSSGGHARVAWSVGFPGEPPFAAGELETAFALSPGDLRELAVAEFAAPPVESPRRATLRAEIRVGEERAENAWPLWFFPRDAWRDTTGIALVDPAGRLKDLPQIAPGIDQRPKTKDEGRPPPPGGDIGGDPAWSFVLRPSSSVVIATAWTPEVQAFVERGGRAVLLQAGDRPPGPLATVTLPFWREAIRLADPHLAWGDFPLDDAMAMQFFGCATDNALDLAAFGGQWRPIFRRLDARSMALHEYAAEVEWGAGRAIVTTLRFEGGQGSQPLGIAQNTAAAYLLWCWATYLQSVP